MSYKGKITTVGTSEAIRLEKDLFKQHPEFKQSAEVKATVIGPGKILISLVDKVSSCNEDDPVVGAFLSFIERDMIENPDLISNLDATVIEKAKTLTAGIAVNDEELE